MDTDLQLNISAPPKKAPKSKVQKTISNSGEYSFISKPVFTGKTIARKRRKEEDNTASIDSKPSGETQKKKPKLHEPAQSDEVSSRLLELSENKGKYKDKDYQALSDDIQIKAKPRSGGWVSSLFKNNPTVPKLGQRLVKPIVEKVFSGKTFTDLDLHPHSVANLQQNLGLKELTNVQQKATPIILQGRDVLVRSQTGSGKTLAYALPLVDGLQAIRPKINRHDGIRAVVVVPTRELAVQTYELFIKLVKPFTWIVPGILSGGQKRKAEKARLRKGLSILVGTPGRINDHLRHTQSLNFAKTRCLILDEADRLLDMGYEKDVAAIVQALELHKRSSTYDPMAMMKQSVKKFDDSEDAEVKEHEDDNETNEDKESKHRLTEVLLSDQRQTVLLSATLTKAVENLAGLTMMDPVFVDTSEGRVAVVADSLKKHLPGPQESPVKNQINIKTVVDNNKTEMKNKSEKTEEQKNMQNPEHSDLTTEHSEITNDEKRLRLKQFDGSKFKDLFKTKATEKVVEQITTAPEDSDSDSDYEYFKVNKQVTSENKESSPEIEEDEEEKEDVNNFQEALQNAVEEDELVIPSSVVQKFLITPMKLRLVTLCAMIIEHCVLNKRGGKMIVFMATTEMVDYHAELLETVLTMKKQKKNKKHKKKNDDSKNKKSQDDTEKDEESSTSEVDSDYEVPLPGQPGADGLVPVELELYALHGSMPHSTRIDVFNRFRAARSALLLCTDVAARGLDLPRVDLVLQYCAPASATDYVHRVGRTGRATHVGAASLLLLPSESQFVRHLEEKRIRLSQADERAVLDSLCTLAPAASNSARAAVAVQAALEHVVNSSRDWLARASRAYTSWVRFYAGYPRPVKPYLDSRALHLGHAAKAFGLRDAPGAVARRVRADPAAHSERPTNRLTVDREKERRRPGFAKPPLPRARSLAARQSSMHTASEFDSGLEPVQKKNK